MLNRIAACGTGGKSQKNASRNLHKLIVHQGRSLPIDVTHIDAPVRLIRGGRPKVTNVDFPVLLPSSWFRYILAECPEVLLGGHDMESVADWSSMFRGFWHSFNESMPGVQMNGLNPEVSIPICIHGDEGRGKTHKPVMVIAWQPLISYLGPAVTNSPGIPVLYMV